MSGNRCVLIVWFLLLLGLSACAKKEEPSKDTEPAPAATKPFVPGEMLLIPAGEFIFGDNESPGFPRRKIMLPAFWIDKFEATNGEYLDFTIKSGYVSEGQTWRLFFTPEKVNAPVINITWNDASAYCKSVGKRLPSEEEWEKAARGSDGRRFPWGEKWERGRSNTFEEGLRNTANVNQFDDTSPYGVHDMLGNVQEWTSSWYQRRKGSSEQGETTFEGRLRTVRGASSNIYGSKGHLWDRSGYLPAALYGIGCRCAKDATPR